MLYTALKFCLQINLAPLRQGERAHHEAGAVLRALARLRRYGRAVRVDPIKPTLKVPGSKRLKLEQETNFKCCFQFQLAPLLHGRADQVRAVPRGRGLRSSTFQLNMSRFGHKMHPTHPLIPTKTS